MGDLQLLQIQLNVVVDYYSGGTEHRPDTKAKDIKTNLKRSV